MKMKGREAAFVLAVLACAGVVAVRAVSAAASSLAADAASDAPVSPSAGEPREIDLDALRRLQRAGFLSGREAEHYKRVPQSPEDR